MMTVISPTAIHWIDCRRLEGLGFGMFTPRPDLFGRTRVQPDASARTAPSRYPTRFDRLGAGAVCSASSKTLERGSVQTIDAGVLQDTGSGGHAVSDVTGERMKAAIRSSFLIRSGVHSNEKFKDRKFLNDAAGENIGPGARLILASIARRDALTASQPCGPLIQQTKPPDGLETAQSLGSI